MQWASAERGAGESSNTQNYAVEVPLNITDRPGASARALAMLRGIGQRAQPQQRYDTSAKILQPEIKLTEESPPLHSTARPKTLALATLSRSTDGSIASCTIRSFHFYTYSFTGLHDMLFSDERPRSEREVAPPNAIRDGDIPEGIARLDTHDAPLAELPLRFLPPRVPKQYGFKQSKYDGADALREQHSSASAADDTPAVHIIPFTASEAIPDLPAGPLPTGIDEEIAQILRSLFDLRPVWHPELLEEVVSYRVWQLHNGTSESTSEKEYLNVAQIAEKRNRVLNYVPSFAYRFKNGPFGRSWIKLGYDPRTDRRARRYQVLNINKAYKASHEAHHRIGNPNALLVQVMRFDAVRPNDPTNIVVGDLLCGYTKAIVCQKPDESAVCDEVKGWFRREQVTGLKKAARLKFDGAILNAQPSRSYVHTLGHVGTGAGKGEENFYENMQAQLHEGGNQIDEEDAREFGILHDFDGTEELLKAVCANASSLQPLKKYSRRNSKKKRNGNARSGKARKTGGQARKERRVQVQDPAPQARHARREIGSEEEEEDDDEEKKEEVGEPGPGARLQEQHDGDGDGGHLSSEDGDEEDEAHDALDGRANDKMRSRGRGDEPMLDASHVGEADEDDQMDGEGNDDAR